MTAQQAYSELAYYTLSKQDSYFIHQHIVDAYTAQAADSNTKPIGIVFSLAGLYLFVEKGFTGRQVQLAHLQMAKGDKLFPAISLPDDRGEITVPDVMAASPGDERDEMIRQWCISVWKAFAYQRDIVISITEKLLDKQVKK